MYKSFQQYYTNKTPLKFVKCFAAPCSTVTCPAHPTATCKNNYCGGCFAIFTDSNGQTLTMEECKLPITPPKLPAIPPKIPIIPQKIPIIPQKVPIIPQQVPILPIPPSQIPNAASETSTPNSVTNEPCNAGWMDCNPLPCEVRECAAYPDATCTNNKCGTCSAVFTDANGNVLTDAQCAATQP